VTLDVTVFALMVAAVALFLAAAVVSGGRVALVLLAAALFTVLAALAVAINTESLAALDTFVENWVDNHRTQRREVVASGLFGYIGRPLHVLGVAVVCGTLLSLIRRSAIPVGLVIGAVGIGVVVEETLKATIGRTATAGPLLDYPHSFPSGHVTGSATLFGMIAVCLAAGDSRLAKAAIGLLVAQSVVFVAALAVYSGAHVFSDTIGGMALGGAIVALGAAVLDTLTPRRHDAG